MVLYGRNTSFNTLFRCARRKVCHSRIRSEPATIHVMAVAVSFFGAYLLLVGWRYCVGYGHFSCRYHRHYHHCYHHHVRHCYHPCSSSYVCSCSKNCREELHLGESLLLVVPVVVVPRDDSDRHIAWFHRSNNRVDTPFYTPSWAVFFRRQIVAMLVEWLVLGV